jgi:hypothetical protein
MIRFLTEEIILKMIEDVFASSDSEEMKQARLVVLDHCLDCLEKGETLTIDSEEKIKLHEIGEKPH